MMLFLENVKLALTAIKSNKMRSILTMLGIIIGISSVIAITSIGDSAKGAVTEQFEGIGAGYLYLEPNWQTHEYLEESDLFSMDEIDALKERFSEEILYAAPYRYASGSVRVAKTTAKISVLGVEANYDQFNLATQLKYGRMINEADVSHHKNNVVIDVNMAKRLFGKENVVGEKITAEIDLGTKEWNIIGVYQEKETFFNSLSFGEPTYKCYIPHTVCCYYDGEPSYYVEIYANTECGKTIDEISTEICTWIARVKHLEDLDSYVTETAESELNQVNEILGILSLAIGAIAAISLLVGGIGIMNIMLVSVTERTKEIGIRKSLGARTKDIMTQFLIEAMILSVIGGIIGLILGIGIAAIGMAIANVHLVVNPGAVILAIVFSAAVGLFFGIFPAKKAAKLDPIEALRYE